MPSNLNAAKKSGSIIKNRIEYGDARQEVEAIKQIKQYVESKYSNEDGHYMFLFPDGYMLCSETHHEEIVSDVFHTLGIERDVATMHSFGIARCGYLELDFELTSVALERFVDMVISKNPKNVHTDWRGRPWSYVDKLVARIQKSVGDDIGVYNIH